MLERTRGFEVVKKEFLRSHQIQEDVKMPLRMTLNSSGYDFYSPSHYLIYPDDQVFIYTDIKAYMLYDEELKLYVRSSIGIKKGLMLANIVGKIDSDYYSNPDNDGNIIICLRNDGGKKVVIEKGERIVQASFYKYLVADNCNSDTKRVGGFGHSGIK